MMSLIKQTRVPAHVLCADNSTGGTIPTDASGWLIWEGHAFEMKVLDFALHDVSHV